MTPSVQRRQLPGHTLTEIDASSGEVARTYRLDPSSTSDLVSPNVANATTQHVGSNVQALRLVEIDRATPSSGLSKPKEFTSAQTDSLVKSLNTLLLTNYAALKTYLSTLFLPTGYPHTVTPDYTPYQIYDSLQAFASSIAGLLSSRAVLQSLNILDSTSSSTTTATAATLLSIIQSTLSNLTTILFASHAAPRINIEVKYYRFLADIVNDAAFVLDLLAPSLPLSFAVLSVAGISFRWLAVIVITIVTSLWFLMAPQSDHHSRFGHQSMMQTVLGILITLLISAILTNDLSTSSLMATYYPSPRTVALCLGSILRAMCGVAGGSSKAVLSAHFARNNPENIGDLNAKDGSQETIIGLLGMWFGGVVVSRVEGRTATWLWMAGLLAAHLGCNWQAVRSVRLRGLNRERVHLVCEAFWGTGGKGKWKESIGINSVGAKESILGLWTTSRHTRTWRMGVSIRELLQTIKRSTIRRHAGDVESGSPDEILGELLQIFENEPYILWYDTNNQSAAIVLKTSSRPVDQLKAWFHTFVIHQAEKPSETSRRYVLLQRTLAYVHDVWDEVHAELNKAGWDLDLTNLEEVKGLRLQVDDT